jgi:hypothetical protein
VLDGLSRSASRRRPCALARTPRSTPTTATCRDLLAPACFSWTAPPRSSPTRTDDVAKPRLQADAFRCSGAPLVSVLPPFGSQQQAASPSVAPHSGSTSTLPARLSATASSASDTALPPALPRPRCFHSSARESVPFHRPSPILRDVGILVAKNIFTEVAGPSSSARRKLLLWVRFTAHRSPLNRLRSRASKFFNRVSDSSG